jgi:hypothetical protein
MSYTAIADRVAARRRNINRVQEFLPLAGFAALVLVAVAAIVLAIVSFNITGTATACVVTSKETVQMGTYVTSNRVHTENCGEFEANTSLSEGIFEGDRMSDSLVEGKSYDFTTRGMRIDGTSLMPNILTATETQPATIRFEQ